MQASAKPELSNRDMAPPQRLCLAGALHSDDREAGPPQTAITLEEPTGTLRGTVTNRKRFGSYVGRLEEVIMSYVGQQSYANRASLHLHITCYLADAYIHSDLQLIRQSPWRNVGLRILLNSPTAVQILLWLHWGSNHRDCGSQTSC